VDRREVESILSRDRTWLLDKIAALAPEELVADATQSAHDEASKWTAIDHLVHLVGIERSFNDIIRRHVAGSEPLQLMSSPGGAPRSMDEIMRVVNETNERWVLKHRAKSLSDVLALGAQARAETLALLASLSDDQLLEKVPRAPWADGTVAGVLSTNGPHAHMHWNQVLAGLGKTRPA